MALTAYTRALHSNLGLKITAFVIGYSMWAALSSTHTTQITYHVPIAFYNQPKGCTIKAPDVVDVTLAGKRTNLHALSPATLALHVDASTLAQGENHITPSAASLFLPEHVDVVNYVPTHLVVHVSQTHEKETVKTT